MFLWCILSSLAPINTDFLLGPGGNEVAALGLTFCTPSNRAPRHPLLRNAEIVSTLEIRYRMSATIARTLNAQSRALLTGNVNRSYLFLHVLNLLFYM